MRHRKGMESGGIDMARREVVICGGGPAGLAASIELARTGAKVLLVDENRRPGGQLFKQIHKFFGSREHNAGVRGVDIGKKLLAETEALGVEVWLHSSVTGVFTDKRVAVLREGETKVVEAEKVLICTGGAENSLNFEGWTLPGVMGAGAAQTMINVNRVLPGRRVLMVGSGNVGVIVTYQLLQAGAEVAGIVEVAPKIGAYGVHAAKVRRAGVPFYLGHTIIRAKGNGKVERAVIAALDNWKPIPGTEKEFDVDVVCIAAGLRPTSDLARMCGVRHVFVPELGGWMPEHDDGMETSVPGIYVAGDTAGVEEASTAMDEGRLAGIMMAYRLGHLTEREMREKKEEVSGRLSALRLGPFGERRMNAKRRITEGRA